MTPSLPLPPPSKPCAIAFKEWAGVCDALLQGVQTVLLRKGGVQEDAGPGRFAPEHREFWLYPTRLHQAQQGLRPPYDEASAAATAAPEGAVALRTLARVELVARIDDEARLAALEEFHVLRSETARQRFHYRSPGLWALGVRVWRREAPFLIDPTPEQAGCKTWAWLDAPLPTAGLVPVWDDAAWPERLERLRLALGAPALAPDVSSEPARSNRPFSEHRASGRAAR